MSVATVTMAVVMVVWSHERRNEKLSVASVFS